MRVTKLFGNSFGLGKWRLRRSGSLLDSASARVSWVLVIKRMNFVLESLVSYRSNVPAYGNNYYYVFL